MKPLLTNIAAIVGEPENSNEAISIERGDEAVIINESRENQVWFEDDEKEIFSSFQSPRYYTISYRYGQLSMLREFLFKILAQIKCYVCNDHGIIMDGAEFLKRWKLEGTDGILVAEK